MTNKCYVACDGLLGLKTNIDSAKLKWSYGTSIPEATADEYEACAVKLRASLLDGQVIAGEIQQADSSLGKYHYWRGNHSAKTLYYKRAFLFGSWLYLKASNLLGEESHIMANHTYRRGAVGRFINLHSLDYLLTDIATLLLLKHGYAPLHCSAFRKGDATVVVFAPANTGKTLTTMLACMEHEAEFIAEDIAISDGKTVYSVPWTSTFRYYSSVDQSWQSKLVNRLTEIFPPMALLPVSNYEPITAYVPPERMLDKAPITHIVLLERGDKAILQQPREEVFRKILNLNRYEFSYYKAPLLTAYEFFNPELDIAAALKTEEDVLRDVVNNATECLVIRTNDATQYTDMILQNLSEATP